MIFKALFFAAIISLICKLITRRWPWNYLSAKSPRAKAVSRARVLLGISPKANRTEIFDAHKRLIAMVHPDRGGTNDQVHEANAARDLLLDELP